MFNNPDLNTQYHRILNLIEKVKTYQETDEELCSHMAKYLCILCSGFIENSIYLTFRDIAQRNCPETVVLNYTKNQLYKIQNANSEKIREITKSFKNDWCVNLTEFMGAEDRGSAINYILTDRHNIAHGRSSDITITKLEKYFIKVLQVIKYIETEFDG